MSAVLSVLFFCGYSAAAGGAAFLLSKLGPDVALAVPVVAGGVVFLGGSLLHLGLNLRVQQKQAEERFDSLQRAYAFLDDELTWTRREVKAVREALESFAQSGGRAQGAAASVDVAKEVKMLKSLVGRLTEAAPAAQPVAVAAAGGGAAKVVSVAAEPLPVGRALPGDGAPVDTDVLSKVRQALRNDRIDLAIQPVVSLPQRKRRFYECFSRLTAEDGTQLLPEQYIEIAEQAGLIAAIDNMQLFRCIQVVRKIQRKNQDVGFFCNISPHTLGDEDFFGDFIDYLEDNAELAPNLIFEFTQADFAAHGPIENRHLDRLAMLGCSFSLDQVQSFDLDAAALAQRQVRYVKLDCQRLIEDGPETFLSLKSALDASRVDVIAEKIEEEETLVELLDFNIDFGQGYLFGEPRLARNE